MAVRIDNVLVVNETGKALFVEFLDSGRELWVPKAALDASSKVRNTTMSGRGPGTLIVRSWFARAEGLSGEET